jgi:NAD(P)-dependent dehydrogenase (short-subunit alcohol dehydrogenase family)
MEPAVFDASPPVDDWNAAKSALMGAFAVSQEAAKAGIPIVYIVHGDDLLGRRGAPSAMVATGLLSAARTAALELVRQGTVVNVVAVGDATDSETLARWVTNLSDPAGPTGEVIRLDPGHLGKALP